MVVANKAELVAQQLLNANLNKKEWGSLGYNAIAESVIEGGVIDTTASLQALVNKAISEGRRTIFLPHITNGQYYVTTLTNADKVDFVGDNSSFVGGYTGKIGDLGGGGLENSFGIVELSKVQRDTPYRNFIYDDFSEIENYTAVDANNATTASWSISNNIISSPSASGNINDLYLIKNNFKLSDGKVSVVWENPNTVLTSEYAGVTMRSKANNDFLAVIIFNDKRVQLWRFTAGPASQITSDVYIDAAQFVSGKPLMLDVEIIGITCNVKVNGKTYISLTDAIIGSYGNGYCGLIASSKTNTYSSKSFSSFTIAEKIFDNVSKGASKYLFLGDSVTVGTYVTTPFPTLVGNLLGADFGRAINVTNGGVSGDTTAQMLARLITYLAGGTYDVVTIMGGTNDSRKDLSIPISTAIANLSEMIKRVKSHGAIPLVYTVPPMSLNVSSTYPANYDITSYNYVLRLNAQIKQLCIKEKIKCIDIFSAFNDDIATYISSDLLHPNDSGMNLIAQTTFNVITNSY